MVQGTTRVAQPGPLCLWSGGDAWTTGHAQARKPGALPSSNSLSTPFKLPTLLCLWAPRSRLPLLSSGAWASCSQSCSNQICLAHVQPAGLPNTQDEAASWEESTKALTTRLAWPRSCRASPTLAEPLGQLPKHAVPSRPCTQVLGALCPVGPGPAPNQAQLPGFPSPQL